MSNYNFDWNELAFSSKKELRNLKATFIAAPRELSTERFTELVKQYLPQGNIVVGLVKEPFIEGFEDQPHFRSLQLKTIRSVIEKVNNSKNPFSVYTLSYQQRDVRHIYEKIAFKRVVLINGSWKFSFHTRSEYYSLVSQNIPFEVVSPFVSEAEAKKYDKKLSIELNKQYPTTVKKGTFSEKQMLGLAHEISNRSYDYCFQTGTVLGKKSGLKYTELLSAWNKVVPYETFAMHYGSVREKNFSPPSDLNYYDTVHAETMLVLNAQKQKIDLGGSTLFVNLLPCPTCARLLCETDIAEIVYSFDHSEGYAVALLERAGKKVRRIVDLKGTL